MSIHKRICDKCGKAYDMVNCPFCEKKRLEEKENPFRDIVDMLREDFKRCGGIDERGHYLKGVEGKFYFMLFNKKGVSELQI